MLARMWRSFRRDFATGVIVVFPLAITIWLVAQIWKVADKPVRDFVNDVLNRFVSPVTGGGERVAVQYLYPGLGIVLMLAALWLIGKLARSFFGRHLVALGERLLNRVPFVRTIYMAVKQLLVAIFGEKRDRFAGAVLFEYPRKGTWAIGFVTSAARGELQEVTKEDVLNVFLPTTPNPTSGYLLMVPKRDVIPLKMSVEDAARLIISGGLAMDDLSGGKARGKRPESKPAGGESADAQPAAIPREPGERNSADAEDAAPPPRV